MKVLLTISILLSCIPFSFGEVISGFTYLSAKAHPNKIVEVEYYRNPPFSIERFNQYLLNRILESDPSDIIDLQGGKLWEGVLAVNYEVTVNNGTVENFSFDFENWPLAKSVREPRYPSKAHRNEIEGWVRVQVSINKFGRVRSIDILESEPVGMFEDTVIDALKEWRFEVPKIDGKRVAIQAAYRTFSFEIEL